MHNAIKNMSKDGTAKNIEYLLNVAENNKYGLLPNSALRKYMNENSSISGKLENNDWSTELKETIEKAIKKLPKTRRSYFIAECDRVFNGKRNLTTQERKLINFREKIITSDTFADALCNKNQNASKSLKNLDYFITSSETPIREKIYVLSKLNYFLSPDYKIHEQLKDKKYQIFSEIINDLVIKTPESNIYNSKDCNQLKHGSCAAISNARKALLYEDKKAYIDVLLQELNDKPYLEVYDITRLSEYKNNAQKYDRERAPKVRVEKADINYNSAIAKGYRIIDASTLHWMKVAGTVGDGTLQVEDYLAFDTPKNGFMYDARIVKNTDERYYYAHELLRTLIGAKNIIKSYDKMINKLDLKKSINQKDKYYNAQNTLNTTTSIGKLLRNIDSELSPTKISEIITGLTKPVNINIANNPEILTQQIKNYLTSKLGESHSKEIEKNLQNLQPLIITYIKLTEEANGMRESSATKAAVKEKLFKIGIAKRETFISQLRLSFFKENCYNNLGLPDRLTQIKNYVKRLKELVKKHPDSNSGLVVSLKEKTGLSSKKLYAFLKDCDKELSTEIPSKIDDVLVTFKTSYKDIALKTTQKHLENHRAGDYSYMHKVSEKLKITASAQSFENLLLTAIENIQKAKTHDEIDTALSSLGEYNQYQNIIAFLNEKTQKIGELLIEQNIKELKKMLNGVKNFNANSIFELVNNKSDKFNKYIAQIEEIAQKIGMPSENELLLHIYENRGEILSEKVIKELSQKFDSIYLEKMNARKKQTEGIDYVINPEIFKFSDEQKLHLKRLEITLPKFRRDIRRSYDWINRELKSELEKLYENIGKRKGQFWVSEEGHSGMYTSEQLRIIEQMTGRPYHIEKDIDMAVAQIKRGDGSGVSSTHIDYNEFSGHAQYVADVKPIKFVDEKTGKTEVKDVILHDNTWGRAEKEHYWIAKDGVVRTDYSGKMGGKEGFVVVDDSLEGALVDNFKYDFGICDYGRNDKSVENPQYDLPKEPIKYEIFNDIILPGEDFRTKTKINSIMQCIFKCNNSDELINQLFKSLKATKYSVNLKSLKEADTKISADINTQLKRLVDDNGTPAMSIDEFNKLPENDPLKLIIQKIILRKQFPDFDEETARDLNTAESIEKYKKEKFAAYKATLKAAFAKNLHAQTKNDIIEELNERVPAIISTFEDDTGRKFPDLAKNLSAAFATAFSLPYDGTINKLEENLAAEIVKVVKKDKTLKKLEPEYAIDVIDVLLDDLHDLLVPESISDLTTNDYGDAIVKFIENKFNPRDDEELMEKVLTLLNTPTKEFNKLITNVSFEDFGIKFDTPENVIKLIQAGNSLEESRFEDEARLHYFDNHIPLKANKSVLYPVSSAQAKFNTVYRTIAVDIDEIGANKYVKESKEEAFRAYSARPAIPQVVVLSNNEIKNLLEEELKNISNSLQELKFIKLAQFYSSTVNKINTLLNIRNASGVKEELSRTLETLYNIVKTSEDKEKSALVIKRFMKKVETTPLETIDCKNFIKTINDDRNKALGEQNMPQLYNQEIEIRDAVRKALNCFVEANFLPKHQARARMFLNDWTKTLMSGLDEKIVAEHTKYLLDALSTKQVLNEPQELLNYSIEKACENVSKENKAVHKETVEILMDNLKVVYKKANRAKLEYKLMKAASNGIATKVGDAIRSGEVNFMLSNGQQLNALSLKGLESIINSLIDTSNDNSTLMLFIEQTGLTTEVINALTSLKPNNIKLKLKLRAKKIEQKTEGLNAINQSYKKFIKAIPNSKIENNQMLLDYAEKYAEMLSTLENEGILDYSIISNYLNNFRNICETVKNPEGYPLTDFFETLHNTCKDMTKDAIQQNVNEFNNTCKCMAFNIDILKPLKLVNNSEEDKQRNEYITTFENEIEPYMIQLGKVLSEKINKIFNE